MGKADIPTPPVVDKRNRLGREIASLHVLSGVAAPSPLVFHFVKPVLAVGPITVQLSDGIQIEIGIGNQDGVFPDVDGLLGFGKL